MRVFKTRTLSTGSTSPNRQTDRQTRLENVSALLCGRGGEKRNKNQRRGGEDVDAEKKDGNGERGE